MQKVESVVNADCSQSRFSEFLQCAGPGMGVFAKNQFGERWKRTISGNTPLGGRLPLTELSSGSSLKVSGFRMTRYLPARHYISFGVIALALAGSLGWLGFEERWYPALVPAVLFVLSAVVLLLLASRPAIEIQESCLAIGKRSIPWMDIRRLDRTGWLSPLIVRLTLYDDTRVLLVYPGDLDSCKSLLRTLRRMSRDALIDGIPYRQYWGEILASSGEHKQLQSPRYRVLRPEDEAEVERLYQRLKAVGHLDQRGSSDDK